MRRNQFYGALIPMFLAPVIMIITMMKKYGSFESYDEKDPYLVGFLSVPNCVLNDSHRRDGHVYLLVGNYFPTAHWEILNLYW